MLNGELKREILTVKDVANYLHCHPSTIYRLVKRGEIPAFRLGGDFRFKLEVLNNWTQRQGVGAGVRSRAM